MNSKFQLCQCQRRDGRMAWIDTIEEDGTIRALHANAHTGNVEYNTHSPDGIRLYNMPLMDLMPNAPDPLAEARRLVRDHVTAPRQGGSRSITFTVDSPLWEAIELLAQEPDE